MKELSVTVTFPGMAETTYRFDESPVRVGRSPDCHLAILHAAIPRELCLAWLEADGRTVRVEERPHLTNPLLAGRTRVTGGVSGPVVELSVGPVALRFAPASAHPETGGSGKKKIAALGLALAAVVTAVAASVGSYRERVGEEPDILGGHALPESPLCFHDLRTCGSARSCAERARLLHTRAMALLSTPGCKRSDRARAAAMLAAAVRLYGDAGESLTNGARLLTYASTVERRVTQTYRRDLMTLAEALRRGADREAGIAARLVWEDLSTCDIPAKTWLEKIFAKRDGKEK